jgi:hypothetical protein
MLVLVLVAAGGPLSRMGGGKNGGRGGGGGFFGMAKANVTNVDKNAKDKVLTRVDWFVKINSNVVDPVKVDKSGCVGRKANVTNMDKNVKDKVRGGRGLGWTGLY